MKLDEGVKENLKWIMWLVGAVMMVVIKLSVDSYVESNHRIEAKVEDVWRYVIDHDARLKVNEKEVDGNRKAVFDLQLAQSRVAYYIQLSEQRRQEQIDYERENKNKRR